MSKLIGTVAADIARQRATWQYRAVEATGGNRSQLGAIVIAMLGKAPDNPPRFGSAAVITSDGYVQAHFQSKDGQWHEGAFVGAVDDLVGNFRGLADHLKLSDAERVEMFDELRKWISVDYRAHATDELGGPKQAGVAIQ